MFSVAVFSNSSDSFGVENKLFFSPDKSKTAFKKIISSKSSFLSLKNSEKAAKLGSLRILSNPKE